MKHSVFRSFAWWFLVGTFLNTSAHAAVTLLDQNDWKVLLGGFAELDTIVDSTRGLVETLGSAPIARPGTLNGTNGQTQFSPRNSRISFAAMAPTVSDWKSKGYLEFDLLGLTNSGSEGATYTSPTLRMRHAYLMADNDDWQIIAGQTWTLFGWQTYYLPPTVSVAPVTGVVYQRTPQITALKKFGDLVVGASLSRPTQKDSQLPNLDTGAKYSITSRKAPYLNSSSGEVTLQPMSVALSGTLRNFQTPNGNGLGGTTRYLGYAAALDTMVPIIAASEAEHGHALLLSGELTAGSGYGDAFTSWSGNLGAFAANQTSVANTSINLDPGLAGINANGSFQLVNLQTFNLVLQYHLPSQWSTYVNVGYGRLNSSNAAELVNSNIGKNVIYTRSEILFANIYHDFTKQIRAGIEYSISQTTYADGVQAQNNRIQVSSWFRL